MATGTVNTVIGTTTTVTAYADITDTAKKDAADDAISKFNESISTKVSDAVGVIIGSELEPMIHTQVDAVVGSIVDEHLADIIGSIHLLEEFEDSAIGSISNIIGSISEINTNLADDGPIFGSISALETASQTHAEQIEGLTASVGTLNDWHTTTVGSISDIMGSVNANADAIDTLSSNYDITVASISDIVGSVSANHNAINDLSSDYNITVGSVGFLIGSMADVTHMATTNADAISELNGWKNEILAEVSGLADSVEISSIAIGSLQEWQNAAIGSITIALGSIETLQEQTDANSQFIDQLTEGDETNPVIANIGSLETALEATKQTIDGLEEWKNEASINIGSLNAEVNMSTNAIYDLQQWQDIVIGSVSAVLGSIEELDYQVVSNTNFINSLTNHDQNNPVISSIIEIDSATKANSDDIQGLKEMSDPTIPLIASIAEINSATAQNHSDISDVQGSLDALVLTTINDILETISTQNIKISAMETTIGSMTDPNGFILGSIAELNSKQVELGTQINEMAVKVSTEAIENIVANTISTTINQLQSTCNFVIYGSEPRSAECSVVVPTNYKYVTRLSDYKLSTDYVDAFGTLGTIAWYSNGEMLMDNSPVNGGSVLLGNIVTVGTCAIYALPVTIGLDESTLTVDDGNDVPASNYGTTTITVGHTEEYNSKISYNPLVEAGFADMVTIKAAEKEGCSFMGWYMVDSNGKIITDTPTYIGGGASEISDVTDGVVTKEPSYTFRADDEVMYAALFEGTPELTARKALGFGAVTTVNAYYCTYTSIGTDLREDYSNGLFTIDAENWKPLGDSSEFTTDDLQNRVLVIARDGMYPVYYVDTMDMHDSSENGDVVVLSTTFDNPKDFIALFEQLQLSENAKLYCLDYRNMTIQFADVDDMILNIEPNS